MTLMVYVTRNNQDYGPYDENALLSYVNSGQILLHDKAKSVSTNEVNTVSHFLHKAGLKPKVQHLCDLFTQLLKIGTELIIPKDSFLNKQWLSEKRLLILAIVGLFPSVLMAIPMWDFGVFYAIALYFSCICGLFFYFIFNTPQVSIMTTI